MRIIIYPSILEKLKNKHDVSATEVEQTFLNRADKLAKEVREKHQRVSNDGGLFQQRIKGVNSKWSFSMTLMRRPQSL